MASIITPIDNAPNARDLTIESFDAWNEALDRALSLLPEMKNVPHELYRRIARSTEGAQKRFVLVSRESHPVAIVGLRRVARHWEQLGHGVLPGTTIPSMTGYEIAAMKAANLDIWMGALDEAPPEHLVRASYTIPVYRTRCDADHEAYWHESGLWGMVKQARRATKSYTLEIDSPDGPPWTVTKWAQKWQTEETLTRHDLIIAADYFLPRGQYHSFRLLNDGVPVAGSTFFVDEKRLIYQTTYFDETQKKIGVGTRLLDLIFMWSANSPYEVLDLGGGHDYKAMWAPVDGHIWSYNVAPLYPRMRRKAVTIVKGIRQSLAAGKATIRSQRAQPSVEGK